MHDRKDLQMFEKIKRILALIGVVLLAGLYLITLVLAFIDPTATKEWLRTSISATLVIPVLLYAYIMVYKLLKKKDEEEK